MISDSLEIDGLSPEMKRLYEQLHFVAEQGCAMATGEWPLVNVFKAKDGALVEVLIPGLEVGELSLEVKNRFLIIDRKISPLTVHRTDPLFFRTVELPFVIDVSQSSAHSYNGVLRIKLARSKSANRPFDDIKHGACNDAHSNTMLKALTIAENNWPKTVPVSYMEPDCKSTAAAGDVLIPKTEIFETKTNYLMCVEIPGIPAYAVQISLSDSVLTIDAQKVEFLLQAIKPVYCEFERYSYRRKMSLFENVDETRISALLKNGVLKIKLPKK